VAARLKLTIPYISDDALGDHRLPAWVGIPTGNRTAVCLSLRTIAPRHPSHLRPFPVIDDPREVVYHDPPSRFRAASGLIAIFINLSSGQAAGLGSLRLSGTVIPTSPTNDCDARHTPFIVS